MAQDNEEYCGSLTLVTFKIPTGTRAWIEDVVVNENDRRKGIGKQLSEYAVDLARKLGAITVDLTSRPSRKDANFLYEKICFKRRETNVYRYNKTHNKSL